MTAETPHKLLRFEYPDGQPYWQARFQRLLCVCGWRSPWHPITSPYDVVRANWDEHEAGGTQ